VVVVVVWNHVGTTTNHHRRRVDLAAFVSAADAAVFGVAPSAGVRVGV
jgi:hypothetical protein